MGGAHQQWTVSESNKIWKGSLIKVYYTKRFWEVTGSTDQISTGISFHSAEALTTNALSPVVRNTQNSAYAHGWYCKDEINKSVESQQREIKDDNWVLKINSKTLRANAGKLECVKFSLLFAHFSLAAEFCSVWSWLIDFLVQVMEESVRRGTLKVYKVVSFSNTFLERFPFC